MTGRAVPAPFSGEDYHRNVLWSEDSCVLCGLGVTSPAYEAHVVAGGAAFAAVDAPDATGSGDLGWFDLCAKCARRLPRTHRKAIRP